jgi:hypothetical protein
MKPLKNYLLEFMLSPTISDDDLALFLYIGEHVIGSVVVEPNDTMLKNVLVSTIETGDGSPSLKAAINLDSLISYTRKIQSSAMIDEEKPNGNDGSTDEDLFFADFMVILCYTVLKFFSHDKKSLWSTVASRKMTFLHGKTNVDLKAEISNHKFKYEKTRLPKGDEIKLIDSFHEGVSTASDYLSAYNAHSSKVIDVEASKHLVGTFVGELEKANSASTRHKIDEEAMKKVVESITGETAQPRGKKITNKMLLMLDKSASIDPVSPESLSPTGKSSRAVSTDHLAITQRHEPTKPIDETNEKIKEIPPQNKTVNEEKSNTDPIHTQRVDLTSLESADTNISEVSKEQPNTSTTNNTIITHSGVENAKPLKTVTLDIPAVKMEGVVSEHAEERIKRTEDLIKYIEKSVPGIETVEETVKAAGLMPNDMGIDIFDIYERVSYGLESIELETPIPTQPFDREVNTDNIAKILSSIKKINKDHDPPRVSKNAYTMDSNQSVHNRGVHLTNTVFMGSASVPTDSKTTPSDDPLKIVEDNGLFIQPKYGDRTAMHKYFENVSAVMHAHSMSMTACNMPSFIEAVMNVSCVSYDNDKTDLSSIFYGVDTQAFESIYCQPLKSVTAQDGIKHIKSVIGMFGNVRSSAMHSFRVVCWIYFFVTQSEFFHKNVVRNFLQKRDREASDILASIKGALSSHVDGSTNLCVLYMGSHLRSYISHMVGR